MLPLGACRSRAVDSSDDAERRSWRKEGEGDKILKLPTSSVDYESWWLLMIDWVTACAREPDEDEAMAWITRVTRKENTLEECGNLPT